jgi:TRAP-type C4-dicarboxylate transport system permease small subunit
MKKFCDRVDAFLSSISFVLMVIFTILVAIQVFSRYAFNSPTTWTELLARYLFVWSIMLYMPIVYRKHANAAFTLFHEKLEGKKKQVIDAIIAIVVLFCAVYMLYWGTAMCLKMTNKYIMGLKTNLRIPMNLVYSAIPVGGVFLSLMCLEHLFEILGFSFSREVENA